MILTHIKFVFLSFRANQRLISKLLNLPFLANFYKITGMSRTYHYYYYYDF